MHRYGILLTCILILLAGALVPERSSGALASRVVNKKVCHTVTKKVNGKKKKVKVCTTVKPKPTATRIPTPTATSIPADQEAAQLAAAVYAATTDTARTQAILDLMRALHVSVFTGSGGQIVPGTARRPSDFYLYDFEVTALAAGIGRGETVPISQLAATFSALGIKPSAASSLDPALLQKALATAAAAALAEPDAPGSMPTLLVRDLGLHHSPPYDLAQASGGSPIALDPLQALLLQADILLAVAGSGTGTASARAVHTSASDSGPCDFKTDSTTATGLGLLGIIGSAVWKGLSGELSTEIATLTGYVKAALTGTLGATLAVGAEVIDLIHMNILAATVDVTGDPTTEQKTHYGPPGHEAVIDEPGKVLNFTVHVEMTADLGQTLISCGPLVGLKFPAKGPIKGVKVTWVDDLLSPALANYGTLSFNPSDQSTGSDGNATLVFTPNTEEVPGFGKELVKNGTFHGSAAYQSPFTNFKIEGVAISVGTVLENVYPKQAIFDWEVARHVPRGFKFGNVRIEWENSAGRRLVNDIVETWQAQKCGESPYGTWNFTVSSINQLYQTSPSVGTAPLTIAKDGSLHDTGSDSSADFHFLPDLTGHPQMQVDFVVPTGYTPVGPTTSIVPVTEDTSCPEPSP